MEGSPQIESKHIAEAIQYRTLIGVLGVKPLDECSYPIERTPAMSSQMTPDQAKFLLALTLPRSNGTRNHNAGDEAIPLDKGEYVRAGSQERAGAGWHIVAAENRFSRYLHGKT